jgi:leucyl aminopeptidase
LRYFSDQHKRRNSLVQIFVEAGHEAAVQAQAVAVMGTVFARDLVNTPVIDLTATDLANEAKAAGKRHGFSVEVLEKKQIESLKMGGLLAVNYGSTEPPVFIIMEHKPAGATNEKPIVLVGKGVVYDTGGLSLKPTNYMDDMKSDMGGAAAVLGTMSAVAEANLPLHVIGLVPATDNRPGGNAREAIQPRIGH